MTGTKETPKNIRVSVYSKQNLMALKSKADWDKPHTPKHSISIENNDANRRFVQLLQRILINDEFLTEVQVNE